MPSLHTTSFDVKEVTKWAVNTMKAQHWISKQQRKQETKRAKALKGKEILPKKLSHSQSFMSSALLAERLAQNVQTIAKYTFQEKPFLSVRINE